MSTTHRSDGALVPGYHLSGDGGLGVLGSSIPSTGANGPGILYSGLSLPADAGLEFRVVITSVPAGLTIFVEEDSSFTASAVADGTYVCTYDAYQDGVLYGSSTLTLVFGAVEPPAPPPAQPGSAVRGGGKRRLNNAPVDVQRPVNEGEIAEVMAILIATGVI